VNSPVVALAVMTFLLSVASLAPASPSPADTAAVRRSTPDAFGGLLGKSGPEVKERVDDTFNRLFSGDNDTQRVYYPAGDDMAYIKDVANNDVRTEGMSYGMMIAVQLDRKEIFDRLWKWVKTFMQISAGPHRGYCAWHCTTEGAVLDSTAASDGEEWFVTSLFFASARWGEGHGIYAYRGEAQEMLRTMMHKESEPDHAGVTNMFDSRAHLVAFVPAIGGNRFTDPSYQVPHFYELWAAWADKDNRFWRDAARASRKLLQNAAHPKTGLSPDYVGFNGRPVDLKWRGHNEFRFDAWRVAMNVAVDWLWFGKDDWEVTQSNRLLGFFQSEGIRSYGNQYTLDGRKLSGDHSAGLVAMNAVAALASTRADRTEFIREFWNTPVPHGHYRYYDGMLYLLAMLQLSGNFRVYDPTVRSGLPGPAGVH
jgi:oligosaccharide reducing-end xylanase